MTSLNSVFRTVGRLFATGRLVSRYGIGIDTNPVPSDWEHVTKVDPESDKTIPVAFPKYLSHTDAISIGGSADVTDENTVQTFTLLDHVSTPTFHEPSDASHVTKESQTMAEFLAVPQVLNGSDEAFIGEFGAGVEYIRKDMAPSLLSSLPRLPFNINDRLAAVLTGIMLDSGVTEAYIVQNPDSAAARESGVTSNDLVDPEGARHRALAAEYVLEAEILYLEYSGTYGGEEAVDLLEAISEGVEWIQVWYGGGIDSREKAEAVLEAGADTIVVGDVFHRIAEEETTLAERFVNDHDSVSSLDDALGWVDQEVELSSTAAAQYLSTIPAVDDPLAEARQCLASGIRARSAILFAGDASTGDDHVQVNSATVNAVASALTDGVDNPEMLSKMVLGDVLSEGVSEVPVNKIGLTMK